MPSAIIYTVTASSMHDAAVAWADNATLAGFTAHARTLDTDRVYVNWLAYQVNIHTRTKGALVGGSIDIADFRTATCTSSINRKVCAGIMLPFLLFLRNWQLLREICNISSLFFNSLDEPDRIWRRSFENKDRRRNNRNLWNLSMFQILSVSIFSY